MTTWNNLAGIQGDYTSAQFTLSPEGFVRIGTFVATTTVPTNSTLTYYLRYSTDGTNWSSWITQTNNANVTGLIGHYIKKIQYKIAFDRTDISITPEVFDVSITINNKYIHLEDSVTILTYDSGVLVDSDFTQIFYIQLPSSFSGVFLKFDDKFEIGYNGTKFYYSKGTRITAGLPRTLPDGLFKIGVKSSQVMIFGDTFTETLI
jgi:hypothetical protein